MKRPRNSAVPGFGLTFGAMTLYLSLVVLIPLAALLLRAARVGPRELVTAANRSRGPTRAARRSSAASGINTTSDR